MTKRRSDTPESQDIRQEVMKTVGQAVFREFNVAFTLMSLIPLIIGLYILAARVFTISIFEGLNGLYFLIAVVFAILGFFVGRRILSTVLGKLIDVNVQVRQHEVMKSAFIANVAYELRPPLAAVQMSLNNMDDGLQGALTDPQRTTVHECAEIVGRLARMTTDLIEITRSDKAKPALQLDVLALQDLIRQALQVHEPYLTAHRLTVDLKAPDQPVLFFGDRAKLLQALSGLIDHAVRWASEGSAVNLQLSQVVPEEWQLVVSHDIAGSQSDFARALDTYARLGGDVEEHLGLGLRLAKEIVELHHGRFWLEGEPGRVSRLMVNLPSLERQRLKSPPSSNFPQAEPA